MFCFFFFFLLKRHESWLFNLLKLFNYDKESNTMNNLSHINNTRVRKKSNAENPGKLQHSLHFVLILLSKHNCNPHTLTLNLL